MNTPFYISKDFSFSYENLLAKLAKRDWVDIHYNAVNYPSFITNVVSALVQSYTIVLIDYRNSTANKLSPKRNKALPKKFNTIEELISKIIESPSSLGIYSSGTTAEPKLIYQSIERLMKSVRVDESYKNSRWAFTYNPSHSAGIQVFLQAICNQATLYDLYKCTRQEILDTITKEKITHISATPTFYRMLAPYDFELPSVESITFNGEKSTIELIDSIKSIAPNARIRNIYGSTESGPLMSSESTTFKVPSRLIDHIKIENDELLIKGELVSKSVEDGEWYHTGDLVKVVVDNPLTIEFFSRKTSILNVGGQNVSPHEVEEVLLLHPSVQDASVKGRPHKVIGNLIVADVRLIEDKSVSEKEIISWCRARLAAYKVPRMIKFVEEIRVGRTGKKG